MATGVLHENATHFLKLNNISINDLNITSENFNDFLKKLIQLSKSANQSGVGAYSNGHESCDAYCNGFVKDIFGTYRGIHGYLSLLVSISPTDGGSFQSFVFIEQQTPNKLQMNF